MSFTEVKCKTPFPVQPMNKLPHHMTVPPLLALMWPEEWCHPVLLQDWRVCSSLEMSANKVIIEVLPL